MMRLSIISATLALAIAANFAAAQSTDPAASPPPTGDQSSPTQDQGDLTSMKNQGRPTTDSAPDKTRAIQRQDSRTGNAQMSGATGAGGDLTSMKNQGAPTTDSAPDKTRMIKNQDRTTGNAQMPQAKTPASFATLDAGHAGYVTRGQAKGDPWLSQHFDACDADHDGRLTRPEYTTCAGSGK